jgi:hypothetical protein
MADGRETAASAANAYAHHIVPTPAVILRARKVLNRAIGPSVENWSSTLGGPFAERRAICG